ncbi:MAG: LysM peptidoglycan-binding domain-containing protein [Methylobacillus sp.]|nr:LysM peptidoglycan-binding domain-containing protein [Methylobacillus sp.]
MLLALLPMAADAAGLGKMTVRSGLGEPFSAEIEMAASKEELSTLTARIAPPDVYEAQDIERAGVLGAIRVELSSKADGTPILKLTSAQPVNDPFLDMLIQVDWASGRLLREYTALLDPPGYGERKSAVPQTETKIKQPATTAASSSSEATTSTSTSTSSESGSGSGADTGTGTGTYASAPDEYVVKRGDTLSKIASQMKVSDVSLDQMLVGLYQANRDAFAGDNMNRLKVGQIIRKPSEEELRAIDAKEARQEIKLQTANWNAYRNQIAEAAARSEGKSDESSSQRSDGQITAKAEDQSSATTGSQDVVRVSSGASDGQAGTGSFKDQKRVLEEELTAQDNAIKEATERITQLEGLVKQQQDLITIKNQQLAEATQAAQPLVPAPEPAPAGAETAPAEAPVDQAAPPPPPPQPVSKPAPIPPPVETSFVDDILQNPMMLGGLGAFILLILGWFLLRRKRRQNLDKFEQNIAAHDEFKMPIPGGDAVKSDTASDEGPAEDASFMATAFHTGDGTIAVGDVDPISDAEVYLTYGRDAQAEEILKEAIAKEPNRYEYHVKLLEIYANRKSLASFETLASELYATLGTNDPIWHKVAAMGRDLEPENPMYAAPGKEAPAQSAAAGAAWTTSAIITKAPEETPAEAAPPVIETTEEVADLPEPPAQGVTQLDAQDVGLTAEKPEEIPFDIPSLDLSLDTPPAEDIVLEAPSQQVTNDAEKSSLDFDLSLDDAPKEAAQQPAAQQPAPQAVPAPKPAATSVSDLDLSGISLDIAQPEVGKAVNDAGENGEESADVNTKLDLVTAYMDMGDSEGARELLEEVVQEGSPKQRERAQKVLASLK